MSGICHECGEPCFPYQALCDFCAQDFFKNEKDETATLDEEIEELGSEVG